MIAGIHMDTQIIELLGRNRLIDELLMAGLEVAAPMRDRGVDLIAYLDLSIEASTFIAIPIQMKAASCRAFSINRKYEKFTNLILAYVWGLKSPDCAHTYALTYTEALHIANQMKWTDTPSWLKGKYTTSNPSKHLLQLLAPYKMTPSRWKDKIVRLSTNHQKLTRDPD
mgnify:CR=1 FL=1